MLQERAIAEKIDRQLTHRSAARSVTALGAMLAHEIKNPLSGIRGAAQLLEAGVGDDDRALTRLICDETDRIVKLVDRMQSFADSTPAQWESLNIHAVLDHVKRLAQAGFARHVRFAETYDPVPAAYARVSRPADSGLPELDQERLGSHWRRWDRRRDHADDRLSPRGPAAHRRERRSGLAAARDLHPRQRSGHPAGNRRQPVRPVRHHQGAGLWSGTCTGCETRRRSRRHRRVRVASAKDHLPRPDAAAFDAGPVSA